MGQRNDMLIWSRPCVDNVFARLEAFIMRRIPQDSVKLFKDRQHFLAAGRCIATNNMRQSGGGQKGLCGSDIAVISSPRLSRVHLKGKVIARIAGDLADRQLRPTEHGFANGGIGALLREHQPKRYHGLAQLHLQNKQTPCAKALGATLPSGLIGMSVLRKQLSRH